MTTALPKPIRLQAALAAVIEAHPYTSRGELTPSARLDSDAVMLWSRLAHADHDRLDQLIDALTSLEVRILVASARSRMRNDRTPKIFAKVLERFRPENFLSLAWDAFLLTDGHPAFRAKAQEFADLHTATRPQWQRLAVGVKPTDAAVSLYETQPEPFEKWIESSALQLNRWPDLVRGIRIALLNSEGVARLDRREPSQSVERWVQTVIAANEREAWYAMFLHQTARNKRSPKHAVLESILARFNEPENGGMFWQIVSDTGRAAFKLWLMESRLTQLLGEGERVDFWRRFLPQIAKVWANKEKRVVFIDLGSAIAVQFIDAGTATYLFDRPNFKRVSRGIEKEVKKSVYGNASKSLGSYEHRGNSWQFSAESRVRQMLASVSDV